MNTPPIPVIDLAMQVIIATTVLSFLAILIRRCLSKTSPIAKHLFGVAVCCSLLLVPIGLIVARTLPLPQIALTRLASEETAKGSVFRKDSAERYLARSSYREYVPRSHDAVRSPSYEELKLDSSPNSSPLATDGIAQVEKLTDLRESVSPTPTIEVEPEQSSKAFPLGAVLGSLIGIYFVGVTYGAYRLVASHVSIHSMLKMSEPIECRRVRGIAATCVDILGFRKTPRISSSSRVQFPLVAGLLRPQIVLPSEHESWTDDQVHLALAHELSHLQRHDLWKQLITQIARVAYWFHPLVGLLTKLTASDCELACDNHVLGRSRLSPTQYAEILLSLATPGNRQRVANESNALATLGMANEAAIHKRICSILSTDVNHGVASAPRTSYVGVGSFLVFVTATVFASTFAATQQVSETPSVEPVASRTSETTRGGQTAAPASLKSPTSKLVLPTLREAFEHAHQFSHDEDPYPSPSGNLTSRVTVVGKVRSADGKQVSDCKIYLFASLYRNNPDSTRYCPLVAQTTTDKSGGFHFSDVQCPSDIPFFANNIGYRWRIVGVSEDGEIAWNNLYSPTASASFEVELSPKAVANAQGRVINENGEPLADAVVRVKHLFQSEELPRMPRGKIDLRDFGLQLTNVDFATRTNENGEFNLTGVPSNSILQVAVQHPSVHQISHIVTSNEQTTASYRSHIDQRTLSIMGVPTNQIVCGAGTLLSGKVVAEDGTPVPCNVFSAIQFLSTVTGADGNFNIRLPNAENDDPGNLLYVHPVPERRSLFWGTRIDLTDLSTDPSEVLEVTLVKRQQVAGTVVDESGNPVEGVKVFARLKSDHYLTATAVSDEFGRFELGLAQGKNEVLLNGRIPGIHMTQTPGSLVDPQGYAFIWPDTIPPTQVINVRRNQSQLPPLTVETTTPIELAVVGPEGQQLAGAEVKLLAAPPNTKSPAQHHRLVPIAEPSTTDAQGRCRILPFSNPNSVSYVEVVWDSDTPMTGNITLPALSSRDNDPVRKVVVTAKPALEITGRISVSGEPLDKVWVDVHPGKIQYSQERDSQGRKYQRSSLAESYMRFSDRQITAQTNEDGEYRVLVDPTREYVVSINAGIPNDRVSARRSVISNGTVATVDLELKRGPATIRGKIVDASGNPMWAPRSMCNILLVESSEFTPGDMYHPTRIQTLVNGDFEFEGLEPGEYELQIFSLLSTVTTVTVSTEEFAEIRLPIPELQE